MRGETESCRASREAGETPACAAEAASARRRPAVPGKNRVLEVLARIPDPEIPCVSVVDLGIVRALRGDTLTITPTYSGCPATIAIARDIRKALDDAGFAEIGRASCRERV